MPFRALILVLLVAASACKNQRPKARYVVPWGTPDSSWTPQTVTSVRGVVADTVRAAIADRLEEGAPKPMNARSWQHVVELYETYGNSPLWLNENGLRAERVAALLRALADADRDALGLSEYPLSALGRALEKARAPGALSPDAIANADVLLTATYTALGEDLLTGQTAPRAMSQDWHIDPRHEDVDSALAGVIRSIALDKGLAQFRPEDPDYEAMRKYLVQYRELVSRGGWTTVPKGRALKPGEADDPVRLTALRDRLAAEGFIAANTRIQPAPAMLQVRDSLIPSKPGTALYDHALAGAVAAYQARHGIGVDSILGAETVSSMNLPAEYRLEQIAANLERFRWLPRNLGERYLYVNVPAFQLVAFDSGQQAFEMKVIVGASVEDRNTPVFSDSMTHVVFRPYWNVTDDIANKELWPEINKDPGYMARNQLETWRENGKIRLRQLPGPKNSLGLVKFMFPNDFNIYLHDTPNDELFEKDVRAFSHGCIRVEKPAELAQWVLGWDADKVKEYMEEGRDNRTVNLPAKIPVYIVYFTTYVVNGQLYFGNDLYKRDATLADAVKAGALPSEEARRAAEILRRMAAGA
ncbi:MAG TPA: L,D-transpeptidase family protein [Gemmatimonadaceae bacterium]|nr:L,D-transpeptidase family protein [Gemmatimonadaceae bacterium]